MKKAFVSDCEGPISKNDNAFELTAHYVPNGNQLFTVISRYDDVLADVVKRPGYKAGDTLKLILPFLKAYNVTDRKMQSFSAKTLILIPNVKEALRHVRRMAPAFIISTSYEHYIRALCRTIKFPFKNTYCTKVSIDKYELIPEEKARLKELASEIAEMTAVEIPFGAKSIEELTEEHRKVVQRLDEIFWKEVSNMKIGRILNEVNPIGGREKADAVKHAAQSLGIGLEDVMYVGDSITDVEAFHLVRTHGGLAVAFNGNRYAIKNAEIAILSETSLTTALIAELFIRLGKNETLRVVESWSRETLTKSQVSKALLESFFRSYPEELPKVRIITRENMDGLVKESEDFRKKVRGEAVGRLG
ncbi:MAG: HAD hydrolase family protein [Nitrososphaerota archaeon]|nr:HAD hydrolase family protein [Candidatus Bathyarchaeota archaeon]MDW8024114.1 HAD hydrolase family protein [Nitrososphaerota archaeon]